MARTSDRRTERGRPDFEPTLSLSRRRLLAGGAALGAALAGAGAAAPPQVSAQQAPWKPAGLKGAVVQRLHVDRANADVLYAVTGVGTAGSRTGLVKTVDAGRTWQGLERGLPVGFMPTAFAVSPDDGRIALVAGTEGLFRSTSAGVFWTQLSRRFPALTALHFSRTEPRTVLAGSELEGNFRSDDAGLSWREANRGLPRDHYGVTPGAVQLAQHPTKPDVWLMATNAGAGAYRSEDGGQSWAAAGEGLRNAPVLAIAFGGGESAPAFVLQEKGLFKSPDLGATWAPAGGPPGDDLAALYVDLETPDHVYVATARGTLHRSTNAGGSWIELATLPRPVRWLTSWPGNILNTISTLAAAAGEGIWQMALRPTLPYSPQPAAKDRAYFAQTGHNIGPTFYPFFQARGALDRFGFPRTEELDDGNLLVQYFQRARLEYHPEQKGTPYEVQISLLGERLLGAELQPRVEPFESTTDQRYFEETGHSVSYAFLRAFNTRGGLDSFGFPISEELKEGGRPVQYFQRARLEYVEERAGRNDEVIIGLIGDEALRQRGWLD